MRIAVVSLFPAMLREALLHGVVGRALERGVIEIEYFDPRDHTSDVHRTVDDRPFGGGPGMVLKVEPLRAPRGPHRRRCHRAAGECIWEPMDAGSSRAGRGKRAIGRGWSWWPGATRVWMSASSKARSTSNGQSVIMCSPAASCPRWSSSMRSRGCCRGRSAAPNRRCRSRLTTDWSIGRIIRGRRRSTAVRCPRC